MFNDKDFPILEPTGPPPLKMESNICLDRIAAGEVVIRYGKASRIEEHTSVLKGSFSGGSASYHLLTTCKATDWWYKFAHEQNQHFLLKTYAKTKLDDVTVKDHDVIFAEPVDKSLLGWAFENRLTDACGRLTEPFRQIMKDIVQGMMYFKQQLHRPHGNLGHKSIFISQGRAKLAYCSEVVSGPTKIDEDGRQLREMLVDIFEQKISLRHEAKLPDELLHLCEVMKQEQNYGHSLGHPVLLSPQERMGWREIAYLRIIANGQRRTARMEWKAAYEAITKTDISSLDWIAEITRREPEFREKFNSRGYDTDDGIDFLHFGRNVLHHPPPALDFSNVRTFALPPRTSRNSLSPGDFRNMVRIINTPRKKVYTSDMMDNVLNQSLPQFMCCLYVIYPKYAEEPFKQPEF